MDLKNYKQAADQYKKVYLNFCDVKIRPAAQRINGINAKELEKFAMLTNYIVAALLADEQEPDFYRLRDLSSILNDAKLFNVRYTQSQEEIKL